MVLLLPGGGLGAKRLVVDVEYIERHAFLAVHFLLLERQDYSTFSFRRQRVQAGRGQVTVKTGALRDDGYVWYTVAEWKPGREEYFWIGVGPFDKKNGSAAVESVWVDEILIEEKE
jgi:hypothetical protein